MQAWVTKNSRGLYNFIKDSRLSGQLILVGFGFVSISGNTFNVGIGTSEPAYQLQLSTDSAAKPTTNTWTVPSDIRVKKDIAPFTDGLNVVTHLNPVSYRLNGKAGLPQDKAGISIIANEVRDIVPYCISTYKAKLEPTDIEETELYDFNSGSLTFVLINAIKEQQAQIASLRLEVQQLKAQFQPSQ